MLTVNVLIERVSDDLSSTPFAVHYEKIRIRLRETATNSVKIHSWTRKNEHLRINQIQLRFLHFNQHSITLLGIHMRHSAYKRERYTFVNANIKVINTILKVSRDIRQTLKCKRYSLTIFYDTICNSIAFLDGLTMVNCVFLTFNAQKSIFNKII